MTSSFDNKFAVVGMGGIFPDANDVSAFWNNIVNKRVSIRRLASDSVEREVFYRPEVQNKTDKGDKSYTDLLAPIDGLDFDAPKFRIPPAIAKHMDDNQKLSLLAASQALSDGGLEAVNRERVCVFMGATMVGSLYADFIKRFNVEQFQGALYKRLAESDAATSLDVEVVKRAASDMLSGTFSVSEDSAPGCLPNIIAARIASVFDLHGHAFVLDAACASGLAAIICGVQQLQSGEADAVICGAADMPNGAEGRILFSGIGALSPDGSFPFDARANGFVIGQGGGVVIVKRLKDAIAAGNLIHAVITGYGQCSDGRGKAIAAPNEQWQSEAIRRACVMAGYPVDTIELIEAHGTSTQVGDVSEVTALKRCFAGLGATRQKYCGLTSVKSNIGHLKSAAGIAAFIKTALALRHGVLPPTASFERENPKLALGDSPFYVLANAREWAKQAHPRRAGVNAFGFGGADYHIALEEYRVDDYAQQRSATGFAPQSEPARVTSAPTADSQASMPTTQTRAVAGASPRDEAIRNEADVVSVAFFSGDAYQSLLEQVDDLQRAAQQANACFATLLMRQNARANPRAPHRLAMTLRSAEDLASNAQVLRHVQADLSQASQLKVRGIHYCAAMPVEADEVALMFPGQGSQYPDMLLSLATRFDTFRSVLAHGDALWEEMTGTTITGMIDSGVRGIEATEQLLRDTRNTHPTVMLTSLAAHRLLEGAGLRAGAMLGHSLGEYAALVAAGTLSLADGFSLMRARGEAFATLSGNEAGAMLALPLGESETHRLLSSARADLAVANLNAKNQTILSGSVVQIEAFATYCTKQGVTGRRLNVSHAFHSPLMRSAEQRFTPALESVALSAPRARVIANSNNEYYERSSELIRARLSSQITDAVRFADSITRLYADGYRLFVEVGPSSVLSALAKDILADKAATVLASDSRKSDTIEAYLRMVAGLFAAGLLIDHTAWTGGLALRREVHPVAAVEIGNGRAARLEPIVYSGVSVGLPGSFKDSFRDDNFEQLFEGHNLIERLTDTERQRLVDLRISKLVKSEQGASYATLEALDQVIQLAGKIGRLNLPRDYQIDEKDAVNMSSAIAHAVAAGYEALRDARIPLVHEYAQTASGSVLPERWALPKEMQGTTGVIFANGFPMLDPIIAEVSRHLGYQLGSRVKHELFEFYDSLIPKVSHPESRKTLTDWFALNYGRLCATPSAAEVYSFNHQLMTQIAMQANNRLAKAINARGPNFQLNAACSSAATAVMLAEEMIRGGRASRIIVIGADDPSSEHSLPYLGAGFLSTGACTSEGDLYAAAIPFDKRRNGMIMGAGAVGIVVESADQCQRRGIVPVCELLGTHCFNTASHGSQLDVARYAEELEQFMAKLEATHGLRRRDLAKRMLYMSHETYTPARGGCSEAEAVALRHVFGEDFTDIEVSNIKGMTGHTMGASIEDAAAAKALQYGRVPPVVNHRVADPALDGLKLSKGGTRQVDFALRMAAGFGSQGNFLMLSKVANGDNRISDASRYAQWLNDVSGLQDAELTDRGRLLVVKDTRPGSIITSRPHVPSAHPSRMPSRIPAPRVPTFSSTPPASSAAAPAHGIATLPKAATQARMPTPPGATGVASGARNARAVETLVMSILSEVTGYATSMLELDMELEADLGIDTVKQATVLARLADQFASTTLGELRISEYSTIRRIVELFALDTPDAADAAASAGPSALASSASTGSKPSLDEVALRTPGGADTRVAGEVNGQAATATIVVDIVAEVTGYSTDLLNHDMELEADLGIDTVKQATVLSMLADRLRLSGDIAFRVSDFSTIGDIIRVFATATATNAATASNAATATASATNAATSSTTQARVTSEQTFSQAGDTSEQSLLSRVYLIIASCSPYPAEMLEPDLTLTSDLGLSHDALTTIHSELTRAFHLPDTYALEPDARIADLVDSIRSATVESSAEADARPGLARQVLVLQAAALVSESVELTTKRMWLWGDDRVSLLALQVEMEKRGLRTRTLEFPDSGSPDELTRALDDLISEGAVDFVVDLTQSPSQLGLNERTPTAMARALARAGECRFAAWKRLEAVHCLPSRALALTCIDGRCGTSDAEHLQTDPLYGFSQGFYRTLRKELRDCRISILDTSAMEWNNGVASVAANVANELATTSEGIDICYVNGARQRLTLQNISAAHNANTRGFEFDDVVLVTGGGAGITAALVVALGRLRPASFAIVGRTALDAAAQHFHGLSNDERQAEKKRLAAVLGQTHARVTPSMIDRAYAELERASEVLTTLNELRDAGCRVEYYSANATDLDRMREVVESVRKTLGPITALIHGAGVEVSHALSHKTVEEFQGVHSIKTLGAYNLGLLCNREPLRRVVVMSSIAGVLGSQGQLDYSAANAFLDLWVKTLHGGGRTRCISLAWSGWAQRGMAARSTFLQKNADAMGVNLIEPNDGVRAAVDELFDAVSPSLVVLHRGINGLLDPEMSPLTPRVTPMVDWVRVHEDGRRVVHRRFSPGRDVFLDQHRIAGTSLMPGVGFMEWMAEVCAALQPESLGAFVFRDLTFSDAFKLYRNEARDAELHVLAAKTPGCYDMQVKAAFRGPLASTGDVRTYCGAQVSIEPRHDLIDVARGWTLGELKQSSYRNELGQAHAFGQNVTFGALFNDTRHPAHVESGADIEWGPSGIITKVPLPRAQLEESRYPLNDYLVNPAFLDAMHQAGAVLAIKLTGQVFLPVAAREFVILAAPKRPGEYRVVARLKDRTDDSFTYDIGMWNDDASLCALACDVSFRRIGQ